MFIFRKEINFIKSIEEKKENNDMEIEDILFKDFKFDKNKKEINYNKDFSKIALFSMNINDDPKRKKINNKTKQNDISCLDDYKMKIYS